MRFTPPDRFIRLCHPDPGGTARVPAGKIYILPTRYGLGFALLLLLMLVGSINYSNSLGFLLTFLLTGLGLVAMLHTWRNLLGIGLEAGRAQPVFAGQEACFEIRLINPRTTERPDIRLQIGRETVHARDLEAGESASASLAVTATRRGRLHLPRLRVATQYPFGLLEAWSYVELPMECLVYPAPGPRLTLADSPSYDHSQRGDRGVGVDDFVALRPYRDGDSPKRIHWKSLAREQELSTKQFGGDRVERRWLDWDQLGNLDTEARLSRLCRGVLDACDQQLEYGLRIPGEEFPPARGQEHKDRCLRALALFGEAP
jgi:uncharacterized protein (DUF58 family)